jgi:ribosome-binding protein aMBF1 (putative translation factor)
MSTNRSAEKQIFLKELGKRVKEGRENIGLSQFQLAIEAEIPKNQVGRIERGEINTSIFTLKRIAEALKIELYKLFYVS